MIKESKIHITYHLSTHQEVEQGIGEEGEEEEVNLLGIILNDKQYYGWYDIPISENNINKLCFLPSIIRFQLYQNNTLEYQIESTERYTILFLLCQEYPSEVHLEATIEMINPTINQQDWNHLPIEEVVFIRLYMASFLGYLILFIVSIGQIHLSKYFLSFFFLSRLLSILKFFFSFSSSIFL